jgi:hypothetical protein
MLSAPDMKREALATSRWARRNRRPVLREFGKARLVTDDPEFSSAHLIE